MRNLTVILSAILITASLLIINQSNNAKEQREQFKKWQSKFGKQYDPFIEAYRLEIFKDNKIAIERHNRRAELGLESYFMGVNQFSDFSDEEWIAMYLSDSRGQSQGQDSNEYACTGPQPPEKDLPQAWDWSAKSAVTAVKDQGLCIGANYAITSVEAIESARFISSGRLVELSPQQVIDCSTEYGNKGCISGNASHSFGYLSKAGIASEKKYPYKGFAYNCIYTLSMKETEILGCVKVTPQREIGIKAAVKRQPVAVSLNAAKLKSYDKGVFQSNHYVNPCKTEHNHWMLLVGYGRDDSHKKNYWKLKNSWGASWGQQGYLYIVRKGDGQGECGVQTELYYPLG